MKKSALTTFLLLTAISCRAEQPDVLKILGYEFFEGEPFVSERLHNRYFYLQNESESSWTTMFSIYSGRFPNDPDLREDLRESLLKVVLKRTKILPPKVYDTDSSDNLLVDYVMDPTETGAMEYVIMRSFGPKEGKLITIAFRRRAHSAVDIFVHEISESRESLVEQFLVDTADITQ